MADPEEKQEEPKLTNENLLAFFHILLQQAGGSLIVPDEVLAAYPTKVKFIVQHSDVNTSWHIYIPKKRTRSKLILHQRTLIKPN